MAEMLKARHGLLALKVALEATGSDLRVQFTVERHSGDGGAAFEPLNHMAPLEALGIPDDLANGPTPEFRFPGEVLDLLGEAVAEGGAGEPIWLHLVKPYGHLGALPWERMLTRATGLPVIRLPDFLEAPREDKSMLETAIISDLDFGVDPEMDAAFAAVLRAWLSASGRDRIKVHVFASSRPLPPDREEWAADERVFFHSPDALELANARHPDPWNYWIAHGLAGRALDAIHLLCRADLSHGRSSIALSTPYHRQDNSPIAFISPSELATGLAQTGAWCLIAAGPPDGSCDSALRHFVDALAQTRPGPVLFHRLEPDSIEREVRPAFAALFADGSTEPGLFDDAFLYCQPDLVMPDLETMPAAATVVPVNHNDDLFAAAPSFGADSAEQEAGGIPNWIAAAQRFAETAALDASRAASGDVLMRNLLKPMSKSAAGRRGSSVEAVRSTLDQLQKIVGDVAKEHRDRGGGWKR